jgi:hypothetical protein
MTNQSICRRVRLSPYRRGMGPTFTLTMWDGIGYDSMGKNRIRYELARSQGGKRSVVFSGSDFATPDCTDSDATVAALLGFLTLKPGDTDAEYFAEYTEGQHDFASCHAEAVAMESERRFGQERSWFSDDAHGGKAVR